MKSKVRACLAGAVLVLCNFPLWADQAGKAAKIEELLRVTNAQQMMMQSLEQVKSMQMAEFSKMELPAEARSRSAEIQQKIMALISGRMSWDKLKPTFVKIYDETFTEGEIDGILNFYKSPAGQAMLQKMPQLMQRTMTMVQQLTSDLMPEAMKILEEAKKAK